MYGIITSATSHALGHFYRLGRLGAEIPARGPVLLVANHPNGLIDPLVVAHVCPRPVRFLAMAPIFDMPGLGAFVRGLRALPVYRAKDGADTSKNDATFDAVHEALLCGDAVCLFPEGISHSFSTLQRVKTGAARMALGAEAKAGFELDLRIVPVGLVYRDKERFHSEAAAWIGEAIEVDDLAELYARDEFAAAEELTARIQRGLRLVTVNMERWEDLPLLRVAERIWSADEPEGHRLQRMAALADGLHYLRRNMPERAHDLTAKIEGFRARLDELGLSVDLMDVHPSPGRIAHFLAHNLLALLIGVPLSLLGFALWCVPYALVRLATAVRPIRDDFRSTVKLFASILFFPAWHAVLVVLAWVLGNVWWVLAALFVAPLLGPFALQFWIRRRQALDDAAVFLRMLRSRTLRERLAGQRAELSAEIGALSDLIESGRVPAGA